MVMASDDEDSLLRSVAQQNAGSIRAERQRAEQLAEATLREQANLLNLTHDAIFVRNMNGTVKYWNRGAEELYGWPAEQAIGKVSQELLKTIFPVPFEQIQEEVVGAGRWEGELVQTRKDGSQVLVASRLSLQSDERNEPVAIIVINNDVTKRKRAEEVAQRSEKELRDVVNAVPAFVWSTLPDGAVDFVNERWLKFTGLSPQDALGWNWQAAVHPDDRSRTVAEWRETLKSGRSAEGELRVRRADGQFRWWFWLRGGHPEKLHQVLTDIVEDGHRAGEVIDRIRALMKKAPPRKDRLQINEVILEIIELTHGEAVKYGISVLTELTDHLPMVEADRVQLQQVLLNLIVNALKAMGSANEGPRQLRISTAKVESGGVLVALQDSGPGLEAAMLERVFESFYTTKPTGLGLGLSICRSIIEAHGGRLWASTNQRRGAIFQFTLSGA
jgi:two-component system, LuxR family, sensor kinase FixL